MYNDKTGRTKYNTIRSKNPKHLTWIHTYKMVIVLG